MDVCILRFVIVLVLLLACSGNSSCPSLSSCTDCSPRDALPRDGNLLCSIDNNPMGIRTNYYERCSPIFLRPTESCQVYVGMRVTLQCNMTELALFHNGEPTGSLGSLTIPYVRQEHEGVYDCRVVIDEMDFNMTVAERSLVVRRQPQVAPGNLLTACADNYDCDGEHMCCRACAQLRTPSRSGTSGVAGVFQYYVFGEDPLDITIETIWLSDTYPVDLQIEWERDNSTSLLNLTIGRWPETINRGGTIPSALLRISANNTLGFASTCFRHNFTDSSPTLVANTSLPSNQRVTEGEDAVFVCEVGTSGTACFLTLLTIEYIPPNRTNPSSVTCCLESSSDCPINERIETTKVSRNVGATLFSDIEVRIPSVDITDNGSAVSCALVRDGVTQWRREAYLTVVPRDQGITGFVEPPSPSPSSSSLLVTSVLSSSLLVTSVLPEPSMLMESARDKDAAGTYAGVACGLFVFVLLVTALVMAVTYFQIRRRAILSMKITADSILPAREKETVVGPSIPLDILPSIHVTSEQHGNNYHTVKPSETCSVDSALHSASPSSSIEDIFSSPEEQVHFKWHFSGQKELALLVPIKQEGALAPTIYQNVIRTSSLPDHLYLSPQNANLPVRIYVSYSDNKSEWVIDYLQPLIESFENTEVTIHDADMIAGQPISEERLRLILEADKVIIVCSPDYSDSPWCQFELYQAITKQPSLAEGKIIPILCDGCHSPPIVVRAVVTLSDKDERFAEKLKISIFRPRARRLSQS